MANMPVGPQRRRFILWSNSRRFSLWFWGFWVVVCVVGTLVSYTQAAKLRDRGIRTQAVVTGVHDGRDSYVTLRFTTRDRRSVTAEVGNYNWSPEPRIGDTPTIIYDPSDPSGLVSDARLGSSFLVAWLFVAGGVVGLTVFLLTYTGWIDWLAIAKGRYELD